jgi:hypothetical protein
MKKTWTLMIVTVVAAAFLATPCLAKTTGTQTRMAPEEPSQRGLVEFSRR